ncbi:MAG: hypothetical protein ACFFB3_21650 [Candidatus Hodarchaeota archaeon]
MTQEKMTPCVEITEEEIQCLREECCDKCKSVLIKLGIIQKE